MEYCVVKCFIALFWEIFSMAKKNEPILFERLNLTELFKDKYYIIPDYQRGYSWTDKQIDDFWNDIIQAQRSNQKHYFGTLYLKYNNETEYYEMIDGQQRLTTLFVLLILLYENPFLYAFVTMHG